MNAVRTEVCVLPLVLIVVLILLGLFRIIKDRPGVATAVAVSRKCDVTRVAPAVRVTDSTVPRIVTIAAPVRNSPTAPASIIAASTADTSTT